MKEHGDKDEGGGEEEEEKSLIVERKLRGKPGTSNKAPCFAQEKNGTSFFTNLQIVNDRGEISSTGL